MTQNHSTIMISSIAVNNCIQRKNTVSPMDVINYGINYSIINGPISNDNYCDGAKKTFTDTKY